MLPRCNLTVAHECTPFFLVLVRELSCLFLRVEQLWAIVPMIIHLVTKVHRELQIASLSFILIENVLESVGKFLVYEFNNLQDLRPVRSATSILYVDDVVSHFFAHLH